MKQALQHVTWPPRAVAVQFAHLYTMWVSLGRSSTHSVTSFIEGENSVRKFSHMDASSKPESPLLGSPAWHSTCPWAKPVNRIMN